MTKTRPAFPDVSEDLIDQAQATLDAIQALWPQPVTVGPFTVTADRGGAASGRCKTDVVDVEVTIDISSADLLGWSEPVALFARMHGEVTVNDRRYRTESRMLHIEASDGEIVAQSGYPSLRTERGGHPRSDTSDDAAAMISAAVTDWLSGVTVDDLRELCDAVTRAHRVAMAAGGARQALDVLRAIADASR